MGDMLNKIFWGVPKKIIVAPQLFIKRAFFSLLEKLTRSSSRCLSSEISQSARLLNHPE